MIIVYSKNPLYDMSNEVIMISGFVLAMSCIFIEEEYFWIQRFAGFRPNSRFSYYTVAIPTMITKSNVFLDPIIYFGMNPQVRGI